LSLYKGNKIGTDVTEKEKIPNTNYGVSVRGITSDRNIIGGGNRDLGNRIGGNGQAGIDDEGNNAIDANNIIGLALSGLPLPNGGGGIVITGNNAFVEDNVIW